jgi:hypothetical protein
MSTTSFPSSVLMPDGRTVTPPGWMWMFAFAIRGVKWAEEACAKPEFEALVKEWLRDQMASQTQVDGIVSQLHYWQSKEQTWSH